MHRETYKMRITLPKLVLAGLIVIPTAMSIYVPGTVLSDNISILLACTFVGGFASLIMHERFLMVISFLACLSLCSYLKEAHDASFYYANESEDVQIRIAHFSMESDTDYEAMRADLEGSEAALVSVQMDGEMDRALFEKMQKKYPYQQQFINTQDECLQLFSIYPFNDLDTFKCAQTLGLAGSIYVDSAHQQIHFITMRLLNKAKDPLLNKQYLDHLAVYLERADLYKQPLVALGGMHVDVWDASMQSFTKSHTLTDSRRGPNIQGVNEHILYSKSLKCLNFYTLDGGEGVEGIYQFKETKINEPHFSTSENAGPFSLVNS